MVKQRDLVKEEYDAGNTELTRLNEAQRDKVQAETDFISALVNMRNAKAQLDAATNANDIGAFLKIGDFKDKSKEPIASKKIAVKADSPVTAKTKVVKVNSTAKATTKKKSVKE